MEDALRKLESAGFAPAGAMEGCSEHEVAELERACGTTLPAAYRMFLRRVGKRVGTFMEGSDLTHEWLAGLTEQARVLAQEEGLELPSDAFAFLGHQGYQFLYFRTGTGDDPEVYLFMEGEPIKAIAPSFTAWLLRAIDEELSWENPESP